MNSNQIFTEDDSLDLQAQGLAYPPDSEGYVRVHKRRLNRSSDEENQDLLLPRPGLTPSDNAFTQIPSKMISFATLRYIGFSPQKATELWQRWSNWDIGDPPIPREVDVDTPYGGLTMTFFDFLTGAVSRAGGLPDTSSDDEAEWTICMDHYGLSRELQEAILDPRFQKIRLSETSLFWARDTIEMRYHGLVLIQQASIERSKVRQQQALRETQTPSDRNLRQSSRSISSDLIQRIPGTQTFDNLTDMRRWAAARAPGHIDLWKGIDTLRVDGLLDDNGRLREIEKLLSKSPGDLTSRGQISYYLSPTYAVAEYYAAWAKRRSRNNQASIVRIELLNRDIERLEEPDIQRIFWPDDTWKRLVWENRRGKKMSKDMGKYSAATLVIATIAKGPDSKYVAMESAEKISDRDILRLREDGNQSRGETQFAFQGDHGEEFLYQHIMKITTAAFTNNLLDQWTSLE